MTELIAECARCGRKSWSPEEFGKECRMTQPDGFPCGGLLSDPAGVESFLDKPMLKKYDIVKSIHAGKFGRVVIHRNQFGHNVYTVLTNEGIEYHGDEIELVPDKWGPSYPFLGPSIEDVDRFVADMEEETAREARRNSPELVGDEVGIDASNLENFLSSDNHLADPDQAILLMCTLQALVAGRVGKFCSPADCFCPSVVERRRELDGRSRDEWVRAQYRNDGEALRFIIRATLKALDEGGK